MPKALPEIIKQQIAALSKTGALRAEVARKYHVSASYVSMIARKYGETPREYHRPSHEVSGRVQIGIEPYVVPASRHHAGLRELVCPPGW